MQKNSKVVCKSSKFEFSDSKNAETVSSLLCFTVSVSNKLSFLHFFTVELFLVEFSFESENCQFSDLPAR